MPQHTPNIREKPHHPFLLYESGVTGVFPIQEVAVLPFQSSIVRCFTHLKLCCEERKDVIARYAGDVRDSVDGLNDRNQDLRTCNIDRENPVVHYFQPSFIVAAHVPWTGANELPYVRYCVTHPMHMDLVAYATCTIAYTLARRTMRIPYTHSAPIPYALALATRHV